MTQTEKVSAPTAAQRRTVRGKYGIIQIHSRTPSPQRTPRCAADRTTRRAAIFVTIGINIGTCITAVLASIGATTNGKRASLIHLLFNCFGSELRQLFDER